MIKYEIYNSNMITKFYVIALASSFVACFCSEGGKEVTLCFSDIKTLTYVVPDTYDNGQGAANRTLKIISGVDFAQYQNTIERNVIEDSATFKSLVVKALNPSELTSSKTGEIAAFFRDPLYLKMDLKEAFAGANVTSSAWHLFTRISFIKKYALSYPGKNGGDFVWKPKAINIEWPGDLVLVMPSYSSKMDEVNWVKNQLNYFSELCSAIIKETDQKDSYFRPKEKLMIDLSFDKKTHGNKVVYVRDVKNYFECLSRNVNSFNLDRTIRLFNTFTETGQMGYLPWYAIKRNQWIAAAGFIGVIGVLASWLKFR